MVNHILVGSYSNDITTLAFDSTTKTLKVASSLTVGHHPSWIASHDAHPSLVWTGLEQSDGKILALSLGERGTCRVISETSSAGSDPCFLWATKDELIIANVCHSYPFYWNQKCSSNGFTVFIRKYCYHTDISKRPTIYRFSQINPTAWFWSKQETTTLSSPSSRRPRRISRTSGARLGFR